MKEQMIKKRKTTYCDIRCEFASFPKDQAIDGSGSCRTFMALWCAQLKTHVTKNAPCEVEQT